MFAKQNEQSATLADLHWLFPGGAGRSGGKKIFPKQMDVVGIRQIRLGCFSGGVDHSGGQGNPRLQKTKRAPFRQIRLGYFPAELAIRAVKKHHLRKKWARWRFGGFTLLVPLGELAHEAEK